MFQLAIQLVNQTHRSIFLTGKAGTGKTTFLKYIRETCPKQMAIVAPTGVAAINAGGVTIHSFFQLPFSPFIPEAKGFSNNTETINRHNLLGRLRFTNEKRKLLQQLELLIIDEISMVRCDTLDAIDTVLRSIRKKPYERFGGVQLLFIGDMFQLPPVIKEAEWKILAGFYNSPYFFDSLVIREEPPLYIEFDKIYRQSEETFIRVLNQVRNNEMDEDGYGILEKRYQQFFRHSRSEGYIILTTHNEQARNINATELNGLAGPASKYEAVIENDFPENAYPADEQLVLKEGAQVMFIKNDIADRGKRYFNGKIGVVTRLEEDKIFVQCKDDAIEIEVGREKWENIRYTLNKTSQTLDEDVLGSFRQFPLRLAWAITIHKSQGLTFDKAIIDAGEAFAPGQVYVALSRCTSLEGLVLKSKLRSTSLFTDKRIVEFSRRIASSPQLQTELEVAKKQYQEKLLTSVFDFQLIISKGKEWRRFIKENETSFNAETKTWADQLLEKINALQETAAKFNSWLKEQFLLAGPAENNIALKERANRAAEHFITGIEAVLLTIQQSPAITDSRQDAKEYNEGLKEIFSDLALVKYTMGGIPECFNTEAWHRRKKNFVVLSFTINAYAGSSKQGTTSPHPALFMQLKELRDAICYKKDLPVYMVAGSSTLDELSRYLPQTLDELRKISGFGDAKVQNYGQEFLDIIVKYSSKNNLVSLMRERPAKRERKPRTGLAKKKGDTQSESFRLYKDGLSIPDIAKTRNLTVGTIETHLSGFVRCGDIRVEELVEPKNLALIRSALEGFNGGSITPVKEKLGNGVSFGEIRLVMAGLGLSQERSAD